MSSVATVSWVSGSTVHIRVFTSDGTLVTEQAHGTSWQPGLFSRPGSSVAATSWTDKDVAHIRLFVGRDGTIHEYRWDSQSEEWSDGELHVAGRTAAAAMFFGTGGAAFLRVYVRGDDDVLREHCYNGRPSWFQSSPFGTKDAGSVAAVAWDDGATWNVRTFTTKSTTNMEYRHIYRWDSFPLAVAGTVLTATRWRDASNNVQMRLYTLTASGIVEWRWDGSAWIEGAVVAQGVSASATSYFLDADGAPHIRLFVMNAAGAVVEHAWDGVGTQWSPGHYPGKLEPVRWWTEGGTLRRSGTTAPFMIRGICYQRTLIGEDARVAPYNDSLRPERSAIWTADLDSMRTMRANAIKIYNMDLSNRHKTFLDYAWNNGQQPIYVILSLWIQPGDLGHGTVTPQREGYAKLVRRYGAHPAVLGFSIGAEVNTGESLKGQDAFWDDFISIARGAREALQMTGQQKIITTGLIDGMADVATIRKVDGTERNAYPPMGATPALEPGEELVSTTRADFARLLDAEARASQLVIDVFGFDIYKRYDGFAQTFSEYYPAAFTRTDHPAERPLLIAEFGEAASSQTNRETAEVRDQAAMNRLVDQLRGSWTAIAGGARSCGGCIFEWADEWWKDGSPAEHNLSPTGTTMNYKDVNGAILYLDEEWFGLNRLVESTQGATIEPRSTYNAFRDDVWNS